MPLRYLLLSALLAAGLSVGQTSDSQLQRMQKEKVRITALRRKLMQSHAAPMEIFQQLNYNIAKGNEQQYASNKKLVAQLQEYAATAEKKRLTQKRDTYLKLASAYNYYAEQNEKIVKAYHKLNSGDFEEGLAEIVKIETKIAAMGLKPVQRDWFTMEELEKTPFPGQQPEQPKPQNQKQNS